jgi:hypothetical protein
MLNEDENEDEEEEEEADSAKRGTLNPGLVTADPHGQAGRLGSEE